MVKLLSWQGRKTDSFVYIPAHADFMETNQTCSIRMLSLPKIRSVVQDLTWIELIFMWKFPKSIIKTSSNNSSYKESPPYRNGGGLLSDRIIVNLWIELTLFQNNITIHVSDEK